MKLFSYRKFSILFFFVKQKLIKIYGEFESAYNFTISLPNTHFNIIFLCTSSSTNSLCICLRVRHIQLLHNFFRVTKTGDSSPSPRQLIICLSYEAIQSTPYGRSLLRIVLIYSFYLFHLTPSNHSVCGMLSSVRIVPSRQSWSRSQTSMCYIA